MQVREIEKGGVNNVWDNESKKKRNINVNE